MAASPSGLKRTSTFEKSGSNSSIFSPNASPCSKSNSFWPDFSTGIASWKPPAFAARATSGPYLSSTRTPANSFGAPSSTARSNPSQISVFAPATFAWSAAGSAPVVPTIFSNDPRWSNARM